MAPAPLWLVALLSRVFKSVVSQKRSSVIKKHQELTDREGPRRTDGRLAGKRELSTGSFTR